MSSANLIPDGTRFERVLRRQLRLRVWSVLSTSVLLGGVIIMLGSLA